MSEREKLIELLASKICEDYDPNCTEHTPHSSEKCYANDCSVGELADFLIQSGVIVPPVKVGDTVYQRDNAGRIYEITITRIIYDTNGVAFDERAIGETIFLNREAIEKALKGGAE